MDSTACPAQEVDSHALINLSTTWVSHFNLIAFNFIIINMQVIVQDINKKNFTLIVQPDTTSDQIAELVA